MRVFYSFPHTVGAPGIGTTALNQVRGLIGAGVEVTLVCTHLAAPVPGATVVQTLTVRGRRIPHRVFGGTQRAYEFHDLVASLLLRRRPRPDVVHVWPRGCLRTLAAATRLGVVSVREAPNAHTASVFEESARAAAEAGVGLPENHSHHADAVVLAREEAEFAAADYLLAPSAYVRHSFEERGLDAGRILDTRYGFDPDRFGPGAIPRPDARFTALYLGRADPTKGLHLGLAAWSRSGIGAAGRLVICGAMSPEFAAGQAELLAAPGVEFLGFVDHPEAYLRDADVLLLPTYTEGSALVTYEAVGSGCVPLVSTAAGAPVRDGVDGLLHDVGDVDTLAGQLKELAADPARLAALRAAGLAGRDELTWARAGRRLADAYAEAGHRGPRPR